MGFYAELDAHYRQRHASNKIAVWWRRQSRQSRGRRLSSDHQDDVIENETGAGTDDEDAEGPAEPLQRWARVSRMVRRARLVASRLSPRKSKKRILSVAICASSVATRESSREEAKEEEVPVSGRGKDINEDWENTTDGWLAL